MKAFILWRMARENLPTKQHLISKDVQCPSTCPFYDNNQEYIYLTSIFWMRSHEGLASFRFMNIYLAKNYEARTF